VLLPRYGALDRVTLTGKAARTAAAERRRLVVLTLLGRLIGDAARINLRVARRALAVIVRVFFWRVLGPALALRTISTAGASAIVTGLCAAGAAATAIARAIAIGALLRAALPAAVCIAATTAAAGAAATASPTASPTTSTTACAAPARTATPSTAATLTATGLTGARATPATAATVRVWRFRRAITRGTGIDTDAHDIHDLAVFASLNESGH